ncbi:MAG: NAD-dependent epimerase/dehydratase family protein [Chitinophagales bacterium]
MKIAVTGASGHIGNVVIHNLIKEGHEVKVLLHKGTLACEHPSIRIVKGDVLDKNAIIDLLSGADAVIHAAAVISVTGDRDGIVRKVNVNGVELMLQTALDLNVKKFVHVSSIHAFRQLPADLPLNESRSLADQSAPAYDRSKRDGQLLALSYAKKGLDVTIVNPTSVVGPPDHRPSLMGKAIINLCHGTVPALIPGGFDFVDVRDVSTGIISALYNGKKGNCYLLAGKWHSITDIAKMLSAISRRKINPPLIPEWVARIGLPFTKAAAMITGNPPAYTKESIDALMEGNRKIDSTSAKNELNFSPRPFEETLADTYKWFVEQAYIKK